MIAALALFGTLSFAPLLHEGDALPGVALVDQGGRSFSFGRLQGRVVVLSFIYTRCADSCELIAAKFARLARDVDPAHVDIVAMTVDPAFDRPAALLRYREQFGAASRLTLVTGPPGAVRYFERRLGAQALSRPGGQFEHADLVVIVNPRGRIARFVREPDWTPRQLRVLAAAASGEALDPLVALQLWFADAAARCGEAAGTVTFGTALVLVVALTVAIGVPLVAGALRDESAHAPTRRR